MKRVAVVGAGLGGLSAAVRLAKKGYQVDVYEQNDSTGGKANNLVLGGYRFDTGPSLLTLPSVFEQLYKEAEEDIHDHLKFIELDPITRYFYPDGTIIDQFQDKERFAEEIENKTKDDKVTVLKYLDRCKNIFDLTSKTFMHRSLSETSTYLSSEALKAFLNAAKIDAFKTMHEVNQKIFKDPKVIQLFDRYATYNGSSPYLAPGTFNLIQSVETEHGGFGAQGGIFQISRSIESLAIALGCSINRKTKVNRIIIDENKVKGISIDNESIEYDIVISNCDVTYTYENLIGSQVGGRKNQYSSLEPSSSGVVFYWGIKELNEELLANNIFFSGNYNKEFDDIWKRRRPPHDPTVYINITSRIDEKDAPPRSENWFVLVNVPYDSGQDWTQEVTKLRERVIMKLNKMLAKDLGPMIEVEDKLDPKMIDKRWSGNKGSIYGISSNDRRSAFRRQRNRSKNINGLYFCGGSAHPGGGMPLAILSGKIASDLISKYEPL